MRGFCIFLLLALSVVALAKEPRREYFFRDGKWQVLEVETITKKSLIPNAIKEGSGNGRSNRVDDEDGSGDGSGDKTDDEEEDYEYDNKIDEEIESSNKWTSKDKVSTSNKVSSNNDEFNNINVIPIG